MELELDDQSVEIASYRIADTKSRFSITHYQNDFTGRVAIISSTNKEKNNFFWGTDTTIIEHYSDVEIHFIYGVDNSPITLPIDLVVYTVPLPPTNLMATAAQDSIILHWNSSEGPGDNINYII